MKSGDNTPLEAAVGSRAGLSRFTRGSAGVLVLLLTAAGAFGWTFVPRPLPVPEEQGAGLPDHTAVPGVSVSRVPTGSVETQHGLSVRGGSLTAPLTSAMVAFVVRHPRGDLLVDAGMGRRGVEHVASTPWLMQLVIDLEISQGVADALVAGGVQPSSLAGVVPTHTHWDHVSGLQDLPSLPLWLTEEEQVYARTDPGAELFRAIDEERSLDIRTLTFPDPAYGPFDRSWDVYDDGAIVVVPLPGHTPGSVGIFVNLTSGDRLLFIGDTSWTREGVEWPADKPWVSRRLVDLDPSAVSDQLVRLHRIDRLHSELLVVPAHDARVHQAIPPLPGARR